MKVGGRNLFDGKFESGVSGRTMEKTKIMLIVFARRIYTNKTKYSVLNKIVGNYFVFCQMV